MELTPYKKISAHVSTASTLRQTANWLEFSLFHQGEARGEATCRPSPADWKTERNAADWGQNLSRPHPPTPCPHPRCSHPAPSPWGPSPSAYLWTASLPQPERPRHPQPIPPPPPPQGRDDGGSCSSSIQAPPVERRAVSPTGLPSAPSPAPSDPPTAPTHIPGSPSHCYTHPLSKQCQPRVLQPDHPLLSPLWG